MLPLACTWIWFHQRGVARHLVYWTLSTNIRYAANPITAREAFERARGHDVRLAYAPAFYYDAALPARTGSSCSRRQD